MFNFGGGGKKNENDKQKSKTSASYELAPANDKEESSRPSSMTDKMQHSITDVASLGFNQAMKVSNQAKRVSTTLSMNTVNLVHSLADGREEVDDTFDDVELDGKMKSAQLSVLGNQDLSKKTDEELLNMLTEGTFSKSALPSRHAVIASCLLEPVDSEMLFVEGQWVERLGLDMNWHLDRITQVHKVIPDDFDWAALQDGEEPEWTPAFDFRDQRMLNKAKIRHPESGLKAIFGHRPWLWQQYACLKLEEKIRFQENHHRDFDKLDIDRFARGEWDAFVGHDGNQDLKALLADPRLVHAKTALMHHIFSPFRIMEGLRNAGTKKEDAGFDTDWNIGDERISAYTYLGVLGSGFLLPMLCIIVQFAAPVLLGTYSMNHSDRSSEEGWCDLSSGFTDQDKIYGKAMMFTIVVLYLSKIVPDAVFNFVRSIGEGDDAHAKIMALRKKMWDRGDDYNLVQMLGYKLDLYMNTVYVCLLYTLNLFILFTTESVIEMMLNAMAVEFILKMDEDFAAADWFDPSKRWLRGGALELVLGTTLRKSYLSSASSMEKHFGLAQDIVTGIYDEHAFYNPALAAKDKVNPLYMSAEDIGYARISKIAKENNVDENIVREFEKPVEHFGIVSKTLNYIAPSIAPNTLFKRYEHFYCWSVWEKVLYTGISPLPEMATVFDVETNKNIFPLLPGRVKIKVDESHTRVPFENLAVHHTTSGKTVRYISSVLFGYEFIKGTRLAIKRRSIPRIIFRIADGFLMWLNIFVQTAFPFFIAYCAVAVPVCY